MSTPQDDDLTPSTTEGYRVGEKKTVAEYAKLDAEDESLARWKASLGISADSAGGSIGDPNDPRTVVIIELALLVKDRPDVVVDLTQPDALNKLSATPFTIKEGVTYRMRIRFRVQHDVISGLRYVQVVKKGPIRVDKSEQMMGSYGPNSKDKPFYEKAFAEEEAPSGMLARGSYNAQSQFIDDDRKTHLKFSWALRIDKSWD